MFIPIDKYIVNVDHIQHIEAGVYGAKITLVTGKFFSIPIAEFENNVLPLLPVASIQAKPNQLEASATQEAPKNGRSKKEVL